MDKDSERMRGMRVERNQSSRSIKFHAIPVPTVNYMWGIKTGESEEFGVPFSPSDPTRIVIKGEQGAPIEGEKVVKKKVEVILPGIEIKPLSIDIGPERCVITDGDLVMTVMQAFPPEDPIYIGEDALGRIYRARFYEKQQWL